MLVYLFEDLPALVVFRDASALVYKGQRETAPLDMDLLVLGASRLSLATDLAHSTSTR